jgi:hypothetical protein
VPEEVKVDAENQLIRVHFGSDSTIDDWKSTLLEVERLFGETGFCRVLVDVRKQTNLASTITLFDFCIHLPRSVAFAVLCESHLEEHRFIENVATNRGITVKDFDSEQDAIEWIKKWPNRSIEKEKK